MAIKNKSTTVILSPLDWGLGHTTRCMPLLAYFVANNYTVFVACEPGGATEKIISQTFSNITFLPLKGYRITYSKHRLFFAFKILLQIPKILLAINREEKQLALWVKKYNIDLIVSDNRYGFRHPHIRSIFITHQLKVSAPTAFLEKGLRRINYKYINRFRECWVPDMAGIDNIAGGLSHPNILPDVPVKYMGPLSRLERKTAEKKYEFLFLLSGPEPQRTILEKRILAIKDQFTQKVLLIRGLPNAIEVLAADEHFEIINFATAPMLSQLIAQAEFVVCRSGYSSVMDLLHLQKKTIYIPTPGQTEQEYLAKKMRQQSWAFCFDQSAVDYSAQLLRATQYKYQLPSFEANTLTVFLKENL